MEILAHRGYWNESVDKNSFIALERALANGMGFESDLRDYMGELVISHDVANGISVKAKEVFQLLAKKEDKFCFAINVKSDGLKDLLRAQVERCKISNYFCFDMSVPQMVEYQEAGLTYFTRQSEVEQHPVMYENSAGVWIDAFWDDNWITGKLISEHLQNGKRVCIVSPEFHGREHLEFWRKLRVVAGSAQGIMLCTDLPDKAREFFN